MLTPRTDVEQRYRQPTPFGHITLVARDNILWRIIVDTAPIDAPDTMPQSLCTWAYLIDDVLMQGRIVSPQELEQLFALPVMRSLSPFSRAVLQAVCRIDYACLCSYGDIAQEIGQPLAARAVGRALAHNPFPILIACHRVMAEKALHQIDLLHPQTLSSPAYMGKSELASIGAWLRLHELSNCL